MGSLFRQTPNNGYPFPPKWPLTLKLPHKLQPYGLYVYYVVHICDFGMLRVKDGYGFGGFSRAPPSKQHLSTPPPPPGGRASRHIRERDNRERCYFTNLWWLIHVYCLNFCYLSLYQTFINLSSRSRIFDFFPSPCQASDLLRTAQLRDRYNVQCIALPRLSGVSARKLPFYLEKQIIWLLSWGYNERDNWNYDC